jgi:hypothetical protein
LGKLKPLFDESFNDKLLKEQGIFATRNIRELYNNYQSGNLLSFDRMYVIFVFQQWFRKWMMVLVGVLAVWHLPLSGASG